MERGTRVVRQAGDRARGIFWRRGNSGSIRCGGDRPDPQDSLCLQSDVLCVRVVRTDGCVARFLFEADRASKLIVAFHKTKSLRVVTLRDFVIDSLYASSWRGKVDYVI